MSKFLIKVLGFVQRVRQRLTAVNRTRKIHHNFNKSSLKLYTLKIGHEFKALENKLGDVNKYEDR